MRLAVAIVRQAPTVLGVLFLGWPVLSLALFFLLDLWLTMTVRGALDLTGDHSGLAGNIAWLGSVFGAIVLVAGLHLGFALPAEEVARFTGGGWRDPWFLASLGLLLVAQAVDAERFRRHLRVRTARGEAADAQGHRTQWARSGLVAFGAAVVMPLASRLGHGAAAIALLLATVNVLAEAFPDALDRLFD